MNERFKGGGGGGGVGCWWFGWWGGGGGGGGGGCATGEKRAGSIDQFGESLGAGTILFFVGAAVSGELVGNQRQKGSNFCDNHEGQSVQKETTGGAGVDREGGLRMTNRRVET